MMLSVDRNVDSLIKQNVLCQYKTLTALKNENLDTAEWRRGQIAMLLAK
jgi:hypothetical protein